MVFKGHVKNGRIELDPEVRLPEGAEVSIEVSNGLPEGAPRCDEHGLAERLMRFAGTCRGLPADLSEHHDHYIHGTPRE